MLQSKLSCFFAACIFGTLLAFPQTVEWKEYLYAHDGFAISAPSEPIVQKQTMKPVASDLEAHFYFVSLANARLSLMYAPFPPKDKRTTEEYLKDTKTGIALSGIKLISEKKISLGNYGGVELESENADYRQRGRYYVIDRKAYTLAVAVPKGSPFPDEVQRWYDSFRLVRKEK